MTDKTVNLTTPVYAGLDYAIAELVAKHCGASARADYGYCMMPHDGHCHIDTQCAECRRAYRTRRVEMWRLAKRCIVNPDRFYPDLLALLADSPTYWD